MVLYTDGVTDQGAGVERSPEQALRRVDDNRTADALADALVDEAGRWTGAARDGVAIVALRYVPLEDRIDDLSLTGAVTAA